MTVLRVLHADEPLLRRKAKKVKQFDDALRELTADMLETMHASNGVGLAATQVGVPQRVIVVQLPAEYEEPEAGKVFVLINPEVLECSPEQEAGDEGCLSVPGVVGAVPRAVRIKLKAQNVKGKSLRLEAEGYLARVFQHELDHLDGILFIDRVEDVNTLRHMTQEGEAHPIEPAS